MEQTLTKADGAAFPLVDEEGFVDNDAIFFREDGDGVALPEGSPDEYGFYLSREDEINCNEEEVLMFREFWTTGKYTGNEVNCKFDLDIGTGQAPIVQDEAPPYIYDTQYFPGNRARVDLPGLFGRLPGTVTPLISHERDCCFLVVGCEKPLVRPELALLPVLVPCSGRLSRSGEKMHYFDAFLSCLEPQRRNLLTPDQQALHTLGLAMVKLAEQLPGSLLQLEPGIEGAAHELFLLWEKALPMLFHQEYVFRYPIGGRTGLRGKPEKSRLVKAPVGKDRPQLSFELHDHDNHFLFKPVLWLRGKRISNFRSRMPMFVSVGNTSYLASSLRDAAILEWMDSLNNRIFIGRENIVVFRREVLEVIEQFYEVKRV